MKRRICVAVSALLLLQPTLPARADDTVPPGLTQLGGLGTGDNGPAGRAVFSGVTQFAAGAQDTLLVSQQGEVRVLDAGSPRRVSALAGGPDLLGASTTAPVDGLPATTARFGALTGVARAVDGTVFFSDAQRGTVARINSNGTLTTIAGGGTSRAGSVADARTEALAPGRLAVGPDGSVFVLDASGGGRAVRQVHPDGSLTTPIGSLTGAGAGTFTGGAAGSSVVLGNPLAITVDAAGDLFVLDRGLHRVLELLVDGTTQSVAGDGGVSGTTVRDGDAVDADTVDGFDLVSASDGSLLLLDNGVHRFEPGGTYARENADSPGLGAQALGELSGGSYATDGLIIKGFGSVELHVVPPTGQSSTYGINGQSQSAGDGLAVRDAHLQGLHAVAATADGGYVVAERSAVHAVSPSGAVTLLAGTGTPGTYSGDGGPATSATLPGVTSLAVAPDGSVLLGTSDGAVRSVHTNGTIHTFAGRGDYSGSGHPVGAGSPTTATAVSIGPPARLLALGDGSVLIAENTPAAQVEQVAPDGTLRTVAGSGALSGPDAVGARGTDLALGSISGLAAAGGSYLLRASNVQYTLDPSSWRVTAEAKALPGQSVMLPDGSVLTFSTADDVRATPYEDRFGPDGATLVQTYADGTQRVLAAQLPMSTDRENGGALSIEDETLLKDGTLALVSADGRIFDLAVPAAAAAPAPVSGAAVRTDSSGASYVAYTPAPGTTVKGILNEGDRPAATPQDGDPLTQHGDVSNTFDAKGAALGRPATVSLFSYDAAAQAWSAPTSISITPRNGLTCAVRPTATTVLPGHPSSLVLRTTASPVASGLDIALAARAAGSATTARGAGTTSSTGSLTAVVRPLKNTTYSLASAAGQFAACTASTRVLVAPSVTAAPASARVARGHAVTISAALSPALPGHVVALEEQVGSTWRTVVRQHVASNGRTTFRNVLPTHGAHLFRVTSVADSSYTAGASRPFRVDAV